MVSRLVIIKVLHSLIWLLYVFVIFWIWYSAIINTINIFTWICIGLVLFEGLVLLIYRWKCPLTIVAGKYTTDRRDNFDIYLPEWLAKHNKTIFTSIFLGGVVLVIYRIL